MDHIGDLAVWEWQPGRDKKSGERVKRKSKERQTDKESGRVRENPPHRVRGEMLEEGSTAGCSC